VGLEDLMMRDALVEMERLLEIMRRLRGPGGCPWDLKQTSDSIKMYAIEEAYEVLEAIESGSPSALEEELGDLLLQVVFHAQMQEEAGQFDFAGVARGISDKLVRRHPHVFGEGAVADADEVLSQWDAIKKQEKAVKGESVSDASVLAGVPKALPALQRAHEVQKRASRAGFDWARAGDVLDKLAEELAEVRAAVAEKDEGALREELGDLLFSGVNVCRFLGFNAEELLRENVQKFERRFAAVEERVVAGGGVLRETPLAALEEHWVAVKLAEK
jgi:MazG family protein